MSKKNSVILKHYFFIDKFRNIILTFKVSNSNIKLETIKIIREVILMITLDENAKMLTVIKRDGKKTSFEE